MLAIGRRHLLLGAAALAAGCNGSSGGAGASPDDMALGPENAPVTLIEYASTTCGHCATFHREVWPQLKTNYIDNGRIRFIFREYPTDPVQIAVAGFQLARCNNARPEQYFSRIGVLFEQQQAIFATGTMAGVRDKLIELGGAAGLSQDQVVQCINDPTAAERVRRTAEAGSREFQITGTPTLILDGERLTQPADYTYEGLSARLNTALGG